MKKTLLALSVAIATSAANAQVANPVSVTENLVNNKAIYQNGYVSAPVHGIHATLSTNPNDTDLDWLKPIDYGNKNIDLGTGVVASGSQAGNAVKWDVFKYQTDDKTTVYQFVNPKTNVKSGLYIADQSGKLTEYKGSSPVNEATLEKGGQIDGQEGQTVTSGWENRQINGEHVIYGYQGGSEATAGTVNGTIVAPDGSNTEEKLNGTLGSSKQLGSDIRYVQTGILANTGAGPVLDPSKNIYGVSARNNNNVVLLTGDGIALADLSLKGTLQTDGSVANSVQVKSTASGVQKTREYALDGKRILEIYNDDASRPLESQYYEITNNGSDLVAYTGTVPTAGTHTKTGTAEFNAGNYEVSKVHNTVTNKNVTYSESVSTVDQTQVKAGVTTPNADTTNINKTFDATEPQVKTEQSVSTGVIGKNEDKSNQYGLEVKKTSANAEGTLTTSKTTVTADGITTTGNIKAGTINAGTINASDYQVNGVSITESLNNAVTQAQDAANGVKEAAITQSNTYTDTREVEIRKDYAAADAKTLTDANTYTDTREASIRTDYAAADAKTLTEANAYTDAAVSGFQSNVNRISKKLDDVEKTAYRGVAIALAAQQQVPNIKPGQFAVFGGVGHYEGESAGALGLVSALADGRTSISAALGVAGSGEVGGRVGVAYVFGGN